MDKRRSVLVNLVFVVLALGFVIYLLSTYLGENPLAEDSDCIDVNHVASFIYDACYDAYDKKIYVQVKREKQEDYSLNNMEFSFVDFSEQQVKVFDVPLQGETKNYKFSAQKNPDNLGVRLDVVKDFVAPICEAPRSVLVKYCPSKEGTLEAQFAPLGVKEAEFQNVEDQGILGRDLFASDQVSQDLILWNVCEYDEGKCTSWSVCDSKGLQYRECPDQDSGGSCLALKPSKSRICDACEFTTGWTPCGIDGFSSPYLLDDGGCATPNDLPEPIACAPEQEGCSMNLVPIDKKPCASEYEFIDYNTEEIQKLVASTNTDYLDRNACSGSPIVSVRTECSLEKEVYVVREKICGAEQVIVKDALTGDNLASFMEEAGGFNILLDPDNSQPCLTCADGVQNGDETGIDCGGSCGSCQTFLG